MTVEDLDILLRCLKYRPFPNWDERHDKLVCLEKRLEKEFVAKVFSVQKNKK